MKESKSILTNINIAAFAAAALILAAGCGKGGEQTAPKEAQAPVVKVMNPIKKKVDMWDEYTARIDALAFVELRARVSGYLEKVYFKEGQEVKVGDMLFRIDQRPYQAALDSCKAGVKEPYFNPKKLGIKNCDVWMYINKDRIEADDGKE